MADILMIISIIAFIAAGVFAVVSVILWFVFKIPSVVGDLSGRTARKSMEKRRQNNERSGNNFYKSGAGDMEGYRAADRMRDSRLKPESNIHTMDMGLNHDSQATGLLLENETVPLNEASFGETEVLGAIFSQAARIAPSVKIELLSELMYIHTDEVI